MKKLITYILPLLLIAFTNCEKDISTYSGGSGIYFDTNEIYDDTVAVAWGLNNSDVTTRQLKLRVCLYGNTASYDRKFNIEVTSEEGDFGAREGIDFQPVSTECVMPANSAEAFVTIQLLRASDLAQQPRRFTVKLIENEELHFIYSRLTTVYNGNDDKTGTIRSLDFHRVIYMDESFPVPGWWYVYGEEIFGNWSATKATLICDVMGIDRERWVSTDENGLQLGYLKFVGRYMYRWLQEHPTNDENGEPMQMGTASQN